MATCINCGAQLPEDAVFCNACGTSQKNGMQFSPQQPQGLGMEFSPQQYAMPQQMVQPPEKQSRKGLIIGLSCGGVVLAAGLVVLILFLTGVFDGGGTTVAGGTTGNTATTAATETTADSGETNTTLNPPPANNTVDFKELGGTIWCIDGDTAAAAIEFGYDNSFTMYYGSGYVEGAGTYELYEKNGILYCGLTLEDGSLIEMDAYYSEGAGQYILEYSGFYYMEIE